MIPRTVTESLADRSLTAPGADTNRGMGDGEDVVDGASSTEPVSATTPMKCCSQSRKEAAGLKRSFLSPKHSMKFATWNVQTLNDCAKGIKLTKEMDRYEIDVLGVAECRYTGSDRITIEDKHVMYSGRDDGRHYQGVALFCSPFAAKCLISWEPINERMLVARFKSRSAKISIIMCYAPTEMTDGSVKDTFYFQLESVLDRVPTSDTIIVMGDMNAKVGNHCPGDGCVVGYHGLGIRNDNGTRFVDCCQRHGLVIGGTIFPHRSVHKGTWRSPDGVTVNQIDHIAISGKHRAYLQDVRALRGADIGLTDHYLVRAKIKVRMSKISNLQPPRLYDTKKLEDNRIRESFRETLEDKCQELDGDIIETQWSEWKESMKQTATAVLGYKKGRKEEWISSSTWNLIQEKRRLKMKMETSAEETRARFKGLHRQKSAEVKRATRSDKRNFYHRKAEEAEQAAGRGNQRELFKIAKELGQNRKTYNGVIKDANGNKLTTDQDKNNRWKEHFQSVLNCPEPELLNSWIDANEQPLTISTSEITPAEVKDAIGKLKNHRSPGEDLITGEMLKAMGEVGLEKLTTIMNNIWQSETVPGDWKRGIIVRIPKKGNLSECSNWRGITLLSVPGKILSNIIYGRIKDEAQAAMREEQAGFRKDRGCSDHIFVLRHIIEQCEEWQKSLVLNFVDFQKAFDSIHRESMWKIVELYGIPSKIVNIMKSMYDGSESCVRVSQGQTDFFGVDSGVRQGDSLSPLLFNIVLDFVMKKVELAGGGIEWSAGRRLKDLAYADDICLLADDVQDLRRMTETIVCEAGKVGLRVNTRKTEIMKIRTQDTSQIIIEGETLQEVEKFVYLGCEMRNDGDIRNEVGIRIGKAGAAFRNMVKVWNENGMSLRTKLKLFNSIVLSVLLYGSESWKGLREIEERVRRFESGCLRKIMKIRWFDMVSEQELRRRTGQQTITEKLRINRWRWYGHVLRMPEQRTPKQALHWRPVGRRRVGRPKDTWQRTIQREMTEKILDRADVEARADDRGAWRKFVADLWTT